MFAGIVPGYFESGDFVTSLTVPIAPPFSKETPLIAAVLDPTSIGFATLAILLFVDALVASEDVGSVFTLYDAL